MNLLTMIAISLLLLFANTPSYGAYPGKERLSEGPAL